MSLPTNTTQTLLLVLPNTPMVIAPSHMHLADPPALLKTPPAKAVDAKTTDNPDARVVKPPDNRRWSLLGDPQHIITRQKAKDKKTDTVNA